MSRAYCAFCHSTQELEYISETSLINGHTAGYGRCARCGSFTYWEGTRHSSQSSPQLAPEVCLS